VVKLNNEKIPSFRVLTHFHNPGSVIPAKFFMPRLGRGTREWMKMVCHVKLSQVISMV